MCSLICVAIVVSLNTNVSQLNNYTVRSKRDVIVVTNTAAMRTSKA